MTAAAAGQLWPNVTADHTEDAAGYLLTVSACSWLPVLLGVWLQLQLIGLLVSQQSRKASQCVLPAGLHADSAQTHAGLLSLQAQFSSRWQSCPGGWQAHSQLHWSSPEPLSRMAPKTVSAVKVTLGFAGLQVGVQNYQDWIRLVAELTVNSLNAWHWSGSSVYYLLGLWSRLVSSMPYLKGDSPSLLDTFVPKISRAYINSRLVPCTFH